MRTRMLGGSGIEVSEIGLGCMGMSFLYEGGKGDDDESIAGATLPPLTHSPAATASSATAADTTSFRRRPRLRRRGVAGRELSSPARAGIS